ncbi:MULTISPECIES: hypothetical protein [Achromobacter]|uniref:hypothetical protein n=1 Tax=Achromobacter TaxID=222 RepID=UPI00174D5645|nr:MULTISPECIES: hypothetical protein [Achromobacter]
MKRLADGSELCDVIRKFADLEWSKYQSRVVDLVFKNGRKYKRDNSAMPPYTTIRFKDEDIHLADKLKHAIDTYNGSVKWVMFPFQRVSFPSINWVVEPEFVAQTLASETKGGAINQQEYMAQHYPDFAPLAYADLPNLAKHVESVLGNGT